MLATSSFHSICVLAKQVLCTRISSSPCESGPLRDMDTYETINRPAVITMQTRCAHLLCHPIWPGVNTLFEHFLLSFWKCYSASPM